MKSHKTSYPLLILLTLGLSSIELTAQSFVYPLVYNCMILSRHVQLLMGPAITINNLIRYQSQLASLPPAPDIVTEFCKEKLKAHGLDADTITIVVKDDAFFVETFGTHHIIIGALSAAEFKKALENPTDQASINIIRIYSTFLDHEIAHLKNNDAPTKRLAALVGATLASYAVSSYIIHASSLKPFFQKPTNLKNFCASYVAYALMSMGCSVLTKSLYGGYAQYQENRADAYAIAHGHDPESLRYAAKYLEMLDTGIIDVLCGSAPINPHFNMITQWSIQYIRAALIAQYQAEKPTEDFRSWITRKTMVLAVIKSIYDIEHPSGHARGQIFRKAADELEALKDSSSVTSTL